MVYAGNFMFTFQASVCLLGLEVGKLEDRAASLESTTEDSMSSILMKVAFNIESPALRNTAVAGG